MREKLCQIGGLLGDLFEELREPAIPLPSFIYGETLNDFQIELNFRLREFQCPCCQRIKLHPELVKRLQFLRCELNHPIVVTSGYRCAEHNKTVGGATDSQHLYGTAADIRVDGIPPVEVARAAEKYFQDGGLGIYKNHVHIDVRGYKARWDG